MKFSSSAMAALAAALVAGLLAAPAFAQQAPQPAAESTAVPANPAAMDKASPKLMQGASTSPPTNPAAVAEPPQEGVGIAVSEPGFPSTKTGKKSLR